MLARAEPRTSFPDRIRLPFAFDPTWLAADLCHFADGDWSAHYVSGNYEGDWSVLPLRAPAGENHPVRRIYSDPTAERYVDTPMLGRAPHLRQALARFECPLRSVRLMRLGPGSLIREHKDFDLDAAAGWARLHVPVTSGQGVAFRLNRRPVTMAPGSVWYLRLSDPHSACNRGSCDRIHLVIDARVNGWLSRMLRTGVSAVRTG